MFIIERLIGVTIYSLFLFLICILLKFTTISSRLIIRIYFVFLCVLSFFYEPYITADLYRIFGAMDLYAGVEFKVRKGLSWDTAYPASNFVVETAGTYKIQLTIHGEDATVELLPQ